jgi:tRNA-dihydrouridine synthase B
MKIGDVQLKVPTILAPMEAVNCEAFLKTCSKYGCGLVTTQAIETVETNFYTLKELKKINCPVTFQIMTNNPQDALALAKQVENYVDVIDFNFGCPLKEILGKKSGGYLLQFPHLIRKIVEPVIQSTSLPVTIKIRLGFDAKRETFLEIGKLAEEIGVSAITLHARYVKDGYSGKARWEKIKELKESISIPVIGNGDIAKVGHAKFLLEKKYCDAVMIGRTAKNNPGFFAELANEFGDEKKQVPTTKEILYTFYEQYMEQEKKNLQQIQDHACWIVSGEKNATEIKEKIRKTKNFEEIKHILL